MRWRFRPPFPPSASSDPDFESPSASQPRPNSRKDAFNAGAELFSKNRALRRAAAEQQQKEDSAQQQHSAAQAAARDDEVAKKKNREGSGANEASLVSPVEAKPPQASV